MVELWSEPLSKRYSNSRFSLAWIFWLGFYIMILIVPLFVGLVVMLEGSTTAGAPLYLAWSTMPQYNALLAPSQLRVSQVASSTTDKNYDGITDSFSINITTPLNAGEQIYQATAWTFFSSELDDQIHLNMQGMAVFSSSTPLPSWRVVARSDLYIDFTVPVPSDKRRTAYNTPVLPGSTLTQIQDILPDNVYQQVLMRNETLRLSSRVPPVWSPVYGTVASFTTSLSFSVPVQEILYQPGVAQTLKFAWVQYLALLLLLYFFTSFVVTFIFRYQIVDTYVASDTRPPQKVHQF